MPPGKKRALVVTPFLAPSLSRYLIMPCRLRSARSNLSVLRVAPSTTQAACTFLSRYYLFFPPPFLTPRRSVTVGYTRISSINVTFLMPSRNDLARYLRERDSATPTKALTGNLTDRSQPELIRFYLLNASLVV